MNYAVLTGDIVDSSKMKQGDYDGVMALLSKLAWEMSGWPDIKGNLSETALAFGDRFARRGGDGWQLAFDRPEFALRAALYVQARLMSGTPFSQSRIAVATGPGTLPTNPDADLNSAHGQVFIDSGRLMESFPDHTLIAHASGSALGAACYLADHISQGWTQAQARAVAAMLPPGAGPRRIAAEALGISRQAVDQALHAAGFPAIEAALELIEADA